MLEGYRVLDLTDARGAFSTRLLADMGAEVSRIIPVTFPPGWQKFGSAEELYLNDGKKPLPINLESKGGRAEFLRLAAAADALVESCSPGYLAGLGLGYAALSGKHPPLIMVAITEFGQTGPYRDFPSSPLAAAALGGQMAVNGFPETPPLALYGNQPYYLASLFAANGVALALWERHVSGRGQYLDIAVMECVAASLDHVLVRYFYDGVVAGRQGSLYGNNAFRVFPCRDGHVLLSLSANWETLVEWLDSEGMAEDLADDKYLRREERDCHRDHIAAVLERWTRRHTAEEMVTTGQLMRFPWAKVMTVPEVLSSPQLRARGFFHEEADPVTGQQYRRLGLPWRGTE
ncbi:MAG: CoA transferase [Chloroflexota bacterium]